MFFLQKVKGCMLLHMDLFKLITLFICSLPSVFYVTFSSRLIEISLWRLLKDLPTYLIIYLSIVMTIVSM